MEIEVTTDFTQLNDAGLVAIGREAAEAAVAWLIEKGYVSGDSVHVRMGMSEVGSSEITERAAMTIGGDDGDEFEPNTRIRGGKLEPVAEYHMDSDEALQLSGRKKDPDDPRTWRGGTRREGRAQNAQGVWFQRSFGTATSGVQSPWDAFISDAANGAMRAAWILSVENAAK